LPAPKKHGAKPEVPDGPSIAVHKEDTNYQKPVPVDGGTTSSQWYTHK
jgi:hypothetical protein